MIEPLNILTQFILFLGILFFIIFLSYSFIEKEKNAVTRTIPIIILLGLILIVNGMGIIPNWVQIVILVLFSFGLMIVIIPFGNKKIAFKIPEKYDERDIMFSRMELKKGTTKFDNYYHTRPENKPKDDLFRMEPGLLSPDSILYNPLLFNAAQATFSAVDLLQPLVDNKASEKVVHNIESKQISEFLKKWTIKLGAIDVGFTKIEPHHIYSHVGRGENYGKEVVLNHKYAIAFTVEMNHESLSYAPKGPIIMESAQQYLNAGTIAIQVAQFIRNLGFDARAHIDANYRLICPVVAQDAGLGTIGRMGLLMTPKLGARVRIGVITTDLELEINRKPIDSTLIQFCEICKKCTVNCPSKAISSDSGEKDGVRYPWRINHEKCFTYWCKVGTDCGRCISVCPYSHPNNFIHNIVRLMIKQNSVTRWLALKLDDYFYGKQPSLNTLKSWMNH